jgi:hypothetical protein
MEYKAISAKVSRTEYTFIEDYCRKKGITPSSLIRELLLKEIKIPTPHHIAGRNRIDYDKEKDNYSWTIELDEGETINILKNVSAKYIEDLGQQVNTALEARKNTIKQTEKGSVPVPARMVGGEK